MKTNNFKEIRKEISFSAKLIKINDWLILRLPESVSNKLSSRGIVMVEGSINSINFKSTLEPDGHGKHWLKVNSQIIKKIKARQGDIVKLVITQTDKWIEPEISDDFSKALNSSQKSKKLWADITPHAKWEWIRWINATENIETRKIRIGKAISKLESGLRRPCCFNTNQCTVTYVSKGGKLLIDKE